MGKIVGFVFSNMSGLMPIKKVNESKMVIGFYHPVPSYKNHILIVPKKIIRSLLDIKDKDEIEILKNVIETAVVIVKKLKVDKDGVVLCANGGKRQDVMQLHFHLFTGNVIDKQIQNSIEFSNLECGEKVNIKYIINDDSKIIIQISLKEDGRYNYENLELLLENFMKVLPVLDNKFNLVERGYSLIMQYEKDKENEYYSKIYITAGKSSNN